MHNILISACHIFCEFRLFSSTDAKLRICLFIVNIHNQKKINVSHSTYFNALLSVISSYRVNNAFVAKSSNKNIMSVSIMCRYKNTLRAHIIRALVRQKTADALRHRVARIFSKSLINIRQGNKIK